MSEKLKQSILSSSFNRSFCCGESVAEGSDQPS